MTRELLGEDAERWFVVKGRRWRREDPSLPEEVARQLKSSLGRARSAVGVAKKAGDEQAVRAARDRVGLAKHGLGERGTPWWEQSAGQRQQRWEQALAALEKLDPPPAS